MAAKGKGKSASKTARKSTRPPKTVVPDRLPPATQAEDAAVNPDHAFDRIPVLEHTANVPYLTLDQLDPKSPEAKARAKSVEDQKKAAEQDQKAREKLARDAEKAKEQAAKDQESRTVKVQALRKGFWPHDGRLRHPGEIFDYHLHRDPRTKKVETDLPSWMRDVEGKYETRETDELSTHDENFFRASGAAPTPFVGAVPAATVPARGGGSSVI